MTVRQIVRFAAFCLVVLATTLYCIALASQEWLHVKVDFDVENNTIIVPTELNNNILIDLFYDRTYGPFKECAYASDDVMQQHPSIKLKTCFDPTPHLSHITNETTHWQTHVTSKLAFIVCFSIGLVHAALGLAAAVLAIAPCCKESFNWLPAVLAGLWSILAALFMGLAGIFWVIICENYKASDYYLKDRKITLNLLETPALTYDTYDFFKPSPVAHVSTQYNGPPVIELWFGVVLDLIGGCILLFSGMASRENIFGDLNAKLANGGTVGEELDERARDAAAEGIRKRNLNNPQQIYPQGGRNNPPPNYHIATSNI